MKVRYDVKFCFTHIIIQKNPTHIVNKIQ